MWIHASRVWSLAACAMLAMLATSGCGGTAQEQAGEDGDPAALTVQRDDLPRVYRVGDDSGCGPMGVEDAPPRLAALVRAERPRACVIQLERIYGSEPALVESAAVVFEDEQAAKRGLGIAGEFVHYLDGRGSGAPPARRGAARARRRGVLPRLESLHGRGPKRAAGASARLALGAGARGRPGRGRSRGRGSAARRCPRAPPADAHRASGAGDDDQRRRGRPRRSPARSPGRLAGTDVRAGRVPSPRPLRCLAASGREAARATSSSSITTHPISGPVSTSTSGHPRRGPGSDKRSSAASSGRHRARPRGNCSCRTVQRSCSPATSSSPPQRARPGHPTHTSLP